MCIQVVLNLNENKLLACVYQNESINLLKNRLTEQFNLQSDFNIYHNDIKLDENKNVSDYKISSNTEIKIVYNTGYIFLKGIQSTERINVILDNTNQYKETLSDLKKYIDKLHCCDYILDFNNRLLTSEDEKCTLHDIGMKFSDQPTNFNTLNISHN